MKVEMFVGPWAGKVVAVSDASGASIMARGKGKRASSSADVAYEMPESENRPVDLGPPTKVRMLMGPFTGGIIEVSRVSAESIVARHKGEFVHEPRSPKPEAPKGE